MLADLTRDDLRDFVALVRLQRKARDRFEREEREAAERKEREAAEREELEGLGAMPEEAEREKRETAAREAEAEAADIAAELSGEPWNYPLRPFRHMRKTL